MSAATAAPAGPGDKHQNSWHWEEGDYSEWAKDRLTELLLAAEIPGCKITKVSKFEGDAYINKRKGRRFAGYEIELALEWEGTVKDDDGDIVLTVNGKAKMPEISPDVDDHECELAKPSIRLKLPDMFLVRFSALCHLTFRRIAVSSSSSLPPTG